MDREELGSAFALVLSEIKSGSLPRTFLFQGRDESARKKAARYTAAAIMCTQDTAEKPCGACSSCKKVISGRHPDVTVIAEADGKAVKVDEIRRARADAFVSPFEAECKIFIFEGAQNLNVQSQNALLKILEEPPENVYFILTAPSANMLLPTVNSRCTKFSLGNPGYEDIYRSVCVLADGESEEMHRRISRMLMYLDGFELNAKSLGQLKTALGICDEYYKSGRFPFELLPTKKEDGETLKLIFKALALCALEVCEIKKGIKIPDGILAKELQSTAAYAMTAGRAFARYEFFCGIPERLENNANLGAVLAYVRSELC